MKNTLVTSTPQRLIQYIGNITQHSKPITVWLIKRMISECRGIVEPRKSPNYLFVKLGIYSPKRYSTDPQHSIIPRARNTIIPRCAIARAKRFDQLRDALI